MNDDGSDEVNFAVTALDSIISTDYQSSFAALYSVPKVADTQCNKPNEAVQDAIPVSECLSSTEVIDMAQYHKINCSNIRSKPYWHFNLNEFNSWNTHVTFSICYILDNDSIKS